MLRQPASAHVACLLCLLLPMAMPAASEPETAPASEEAAAEPDDSDDLNILYTLGFLMSDRIGITKMELSEPELQSLLRGLSDGVNGKEPAVDINRHARHMQPFQNKRMRRVSDREKRFAEEFIAAAAKEPGARATESGLVYRDVEVGTGAAPKELDAVKVHYHGTLRDGTVFDSSVERGNPAVFPLDRVISCWTEALQLMKVGGKARITCPPDIAYGTRGHGQIPPGAALRFEVELIAIEE